MNGFINLNKPKGFTSFDCVAKLRGILKFKKIGHGGTLDPDAEGVLPIAVGQATRLLEYVTEAKKKYRASIKFGIKTTTQDASGETISIKECPNLSKIEVIKALTFFNGEISQIPPMFSALKVDGKRLYQLARKNIEVERQPRKVHIYHLELLDFLPGEYPEAIIDVTCSKGTYIRTLIEDIGELLSTHAHMSYLLRLAVGEFSLENSVTFTEISSYIQHDNQSYLLPLDYQLNNFSKVVVESDKARLVQNGVAINKKDFIDYVPGYNNICRVYNQQQFIAIGTIQDNYLKVEKVFVKGD